jgi:release factor glutamine methyltransferase
MSCPKGMAFKIFDNMTIKQAIKTFSQQLKASSSSPILDIELLLTKVLNKPKEYLYEFPEIKLINSQLTKFKRFFKRRMAGEPIAYILGHKEFYNLDFKVNKNVLIPRPETEMLIEEVLSFTSGIKSQNIIEIGVGSGAIIIALAKNIKTASFYASDISSKALNVAKQNAKKHKAKIKFFKGDLLEPIIKTPNFQSLISKAIIVANLPYLDQKEKNLLPSSDTRGLKFEPRLAWDGGLNGLKYFCEFFQQIRTYQLNPQAIFLEIGYVQGEKIKRLANLVFPDYKIEIKKDLCGFDRVAKVTK